MSQISETISDFCKKLPSGSNLVVAYSGGCDSHVLLRAVSDYCSESGHCNVRAIHIDHGLHSASAVWAQHCRVICQALLIPLQVLPLKLKVKTGESIEQAARQARYAAFASVLQQSEYLLTAHTLEDQAETFLLQLLRGSGPKGLAGIAKKAPLGKGYLFRPLLNVSREQIRQYAFLHALKWIEDPSNTNLRFTRNYIRHEIFPVLAKLAPAFAACIARSSEHCATTQELLEEYLAEEITKYISEDQKQLDIYAFKDKPFTKQQLLLRYWLKLNKVLLPSSKKLATILSQMITAAHDTSPCVRWSIFSVRRHKNKLFLLIGEETEQLPTFLGSWQLDIPLKLTSGESWQATLKQGQGLSCNKLPNQIVEVKFRQGGEKYQKAGEKHHKSLKKLLNTLAIPPWERAKLPLLYVKQQLIAVADLLVCEGWQVEHPKEWGWVIEKVNLPKCEAP